MRRAIFIEIDTERENGDVVKIGPMRVFENQEDAPFDYPLDIGMTTEALCCLIRSAPQNGHDEAKILENVIKHLKRGFVDESYKTETFKRQ